jgi:chemotaxis protein CheZ
MSRSETTELKGCIEALKAEGERRISADELSDIIGEVARTLTADLGPLGEPAAADGGSEPDPAPVREPSSAGNVAAAQDALSGIGMIDAGEGPLAELWHQLDEIRTATQDAAARFLVCAEDVETIAERPDMDTEDQALFEQLATDMFEATSFQDLTGQRLTRIGEILRQVEYLVASANASLGDESAALAAETLSEDLEKTEQRKVEYILHGPEDAGTANTQEEIDKILASFD